MTTYRFVGIEDAQTPEAAEEFVSRDTGGAVGAIAGRTVEVLGGFRCEVFSLDGHQPIPDASDAPSDPASSDRERWQVESAPDESRGWCPYSNPAPDAGKQGNKQ